MTLKWVLRREGRGKKRTKEESEALREDLDELVRKLNSFSKDLRVEMEISRIHHNPEKEG